MGLDSYIARQFGKPEGLGGRLTAAVMNRQNRALYEGTERLLAPCGSDMVLDIGCGNGYVLEMLARRCGCRCVGIDISESILKAAARRNRRSVERGSMSFACCEAASVAFDDAAFDKAYAINTVYFWDDLDGTMAEIRRVLKQGGTFANTLYTNETLARLSHTQYGYRLVPRERLEAAAHDAGFETETSFLAGGAAYCMVCRAR